MGEFCKVLRKECGRLWREESGVAMMLFLCLSLVLFILCLSAWFFGENIRRKAELQNVCDAAAYSAAAVQADGLSRMAVVNRAMSWSYIQMTKMQMDYITLRWLELTKERYEKDYRNTCPTSLGRMFSHKAGYHTFEHEWSWPPLAPIRAWLRIGFPTPSTIPFRIKFGFDCKDKLHDKPHEGNGSYIGVKESAGDTVDRLNKVRLNKPITEQSNLDTSATWMSKDDLDTAVSDLESDYGEGGKLLEAPIKAMKSAISTFNALLPLINRQMATAIEETAVKTLYENLPRDNEGNVDQSLIDDYRWTVSGGVSKPPAQYPSGSGGFDTVNEIMCAYDSSYFSGLRNTEEDEMLFLNMADGIPKHVKGKEVRLLDYFADETTASYLNPTASGLDQWFIRCNPADSQNSTSIKIARDFTTVPNGIVRAYKNANYDEGASSTSKLQSFMGGVFKDIHRGNHVTDILDMDITSPNISKLSIPNYGGAKDISNGGMSSRVHIPSKGRRWQIRKRAKHNAAKQVRNIMRGFDSQFAQFMNPVQGALNKVVNLVSKLANGVFKLDVEPSCVNDRRRFVDQCSNVRNTTALLSEYEWASAYWFCNWGEIDVNLIIAAAHFEWCVHPFLPMAALHGGRKDAKANHSIHTGGEKGTDSYASPKWSEFLGGIVGVPLTWLPEEYRMFKDGGHSREKYRSSFMSLDGDIPDCCVAHNTYTPLGYNGGKRSNYLLKGFTRIYGDDRSVYNEHYSGVPAKPWVLNEKFFKGGGSIIVGISRKQRNVFDWIVEAAKKTDPKATMGQPSIFSAFSPVEEPEQHFVALSAARAGYAPRTGYSRAEGGDSVNANEARAARRFEVRFDAVTEKKLGADGYPILPDASKVKGLDANEKYYIEHNGRIGCVCGTPNTTWRLSHQWNLSQTDWDAVLIPLRHAYAGHTEYDSVKEGLDSAKSEWRFADSLGDGDSVALGVGSLLFNQAKWRPFRRDDGSDDRKTLKTSDVIPLPNGDTPPATLFRKRRIL